MFVRWFWQKLTPIHLIQCGLLPIIYQDALFDNGWVRDNKNLIVKFPMDFLHLINYQPWRCRSHGAAFGRSQKIKPLSDSRKIKTAELTESRREIKGSKAINAWQEALHQFQSGHDSGKKLHVSLCASQRALRSNCISFKLKKFAKKTQCCRFVIQSFAYYISQQRRLAYCCLKIVNSIVIK